MRHAVRLGALLAVIALGMAAPAAGEIYRWTDASGQEHFTTDPAQVPAGQRGRARPASGASSGTLSVMESGAPGSRPAQDTPAAPTGEASPPAPAAEKIGGDDEAGWRQRVEKLGSEIAALESAAERCGESAAVRWKPGAGREAYEREAAEAERCQRVHDDLKARRMQMERLEEQAHRQGVPPGWLR